MNIARQWLGSGLITEGDYQKFDTIVAEKFGIPARSISVSYTHLDVYKRQHIEFA